MRPLELPHEQKPEEGTVCFLVSLGRGILIDTLTTNPIDTYMISMGTEGTGHTIIRATPLDTAHIIIRIVSSGTTISVMTMALAMEGIIIRIMIIIDTITSVATVIATVTLVAMDLTTTRTTAMGTITSDMITVEDTQHIIVRSIITVDSEETCTTTTATAIYDSRIMTMGGSHTTITMADKMRSTTLDLLITILDTVTQAIVPTVVRITPTKVRTPLTDTPGPCTPPLAVTSEYLTAAISMGDGTTEVTST